MGYTYIHGHISHIRDTDSVSTDLRGAWKCQEFIVSGSIEEDNPVDTSDIYTTEVF